MGMWRAREGKSPPSRTRKSRKRTRSKEQHAKMRVKRRFKRRVAAMTKTRRENLTPEQIAALKRRRASRGAEREAE